MSGRRGRKKAPAKQQQLSQDADDELLNPESTVKPTAPAAPTSPLVTLATHAISPIVAAARAVTTAAVAALPTIPETHAAVAAQAVDIDHELDATPRSPTSPLSPHATNNPFTAPATLKQTRSRVGFGAVTTVAQQDHDADDLLKQNGHQQDQDLQYAGDKGSTSGNRSLTASLTSFLSHFCSYICYTIMLLSLLGFIGLVLQQRTVLKMQQDSILQQQQQVTAQAAALESIQQQLQQAKQQLKQLPDQQQLEAVAATCSAGLEGLNTAQTLLNSSLGQLETVAQQLAADITALQQTSKVGVQAWEVLSAAMAPESFPTTTSSDMAAASAARQPPVDAAASAAAAAGAAGSSTPSPQALRLQCYAEQQASTQLLQESKHALEYIPAKLKLEVQQQLAAKLPPLDVALADCGARVVFYTALNITRYLQDALAGNSWLLAAGFESDVNKLATTADGRQLPARSADPSLQGSAETRDHSAASAAAAAPDTAAGAQQASNSILQGMHAFIASQLRQLLQTEDPTAVNATAVAAAAAASRDRQWKLLQQRSQRNLMSLEHITSLLLRPAGLAAGACVPLLLQEGAPAVVEIALPQMMEVRSVTLHHPATSPSDAPSGDTAAWFQRAPGQVTVALVNSSSCNTATPVSSSSGHSKPVLCSAAGVRHKEDSTTVAMDDSSDSLEKSNSSHSGFVGGAADIAAVLHQSASAAGSPAGAHRLASKAAVETGALVLDGVLGVQKEVQLTAESYIAGNGRVVVSMQQEAGLLHGGSGEGKAGHTSAAAADGHQPGVKHAVFADRLVVQVSSSVGGGSEVYLQRISVQGAPTEAAAFC